MDNLFKQIEYRGHHINIYRDENPDSPREWDPLGTFYTAHGRYQPEKNFYKHFDMDEVYENGHPGVFSAAFLKKHIALNIYLYDHSGLTISSSPFSCRWDSGWFGMVAVDIEKVKKEYGWKVLTQSHRRKIEGYLQGEIDTYDQYLRGDVYGFQVTPAEDDTDIIESCWGYYGDDGLKQIEAECRATIDYHIADQKKQAWLERIRIFGPELPFPEFAVATC